MAYSNIYGSDELGKILRRAKQLQAFGEPLSPNAIRGATRGALEARAARAKENAMLALHKEELSLKERAITDEASYKNAYLAQLAKERKQGGKVSMLSGFLQTGALGLHGYSILRSATTTTPLAVYPTTPMVIPSASTIGSVNLPAGVSPFYTGAQTTGATSAGTAGLTEAGLTAAGTEAGLTAAGTAAGVGIGSTVAHEAAFAEGSAATAGTGGGAFAGAGVGVGGGLLGGSVAQWATKAGQPGHEGGEVWTGRAIGARRNYFGGRYRT